jgi:thioredoxin reductase (NADPH)
LTNAAASMRLTLLSRAYCHLCEEMESALRPLIGSTPLDVVDVDAPAHAALEVAYGDAVPVLFAGEPRAGNEVCRHRLDAGRLAAALAGSLEIR